MRKFKFLIENLKVLFFCFVFLLKVTIFVQHYFFSENCCSKLLSDVWYSLWVLEPFLSTLSYSFPPYDSSPPGLCAVVVWSLSSKLWAQGATTFSTLAAAAWDLTKYHQLSTEPQEDALGPLRDTFLRGPWACTAKISLETINSRIWLLAHSGAACFRGESYNKLGRETCPLSNCSFFTGISPPPYTPIS